MKLCSTIFLLISLTALPVAAKTSLLGGNYLWGLSTDFHGQNSALGADPQPSLLMRGTAANLAQVRQTAYSFSFGLDMARISDGDDHTNFRRGAPTFFGMALPMGELGTFGIGYNQLGHSAYNYYHGEMRLSSNPGASETDDPRHLYGTKSTDFFSDLMAWQLGFAREFAPFFRPGIAYERRTLTRQNAQTTLLHDFNIGSIDTTRWEHSAPAIQLALQGDVGDFSYAVGGTYVFEDDLRMRRNITSIRTVNDNFSGRELHDSSEVTQEYGMKLPPEATFGLGYRFSRHFRVYLDYSRIQWENFWTDADDLDREYQNTNHIAGTAKYTPAIHKLNPGFWETITYSGGFSLKSLPVEGDREFSLNMGMGMPLGANGELTVALESGIRRSDDFDYDESFATLWFTIGGGQ
ncbi:hypothetical protein [Chitinivibrio alkaliphilus]|uniref:Long-chain fatty acid transport protein n=1 Tax=Chitinivibrio alkaliphilus ACht1 TaxID=1313304 RepID=U7D6I1_9BACT|nr:hypothetical protein [Chitinivibrio alkaliphilus]ERP31543.1 hypothetical protein CALK_1588 [Chitinivibrio alkaliphilus ACht1]